MAKFETLNNKYKKQVLEKLNEQFGIEALPYLLIKQGKERIRAFSGSLSREELETLGENVNIETLGVYLCKEENDGLRLSHDAVQLLRNQIKKSIIELNDEQALEWLKGWDLEINSEVRGFVILKHKEYFIGCGKASNGRVANFVPKERRIKS